MTCCVDRPVFVCIVYDNVSGILLEYAIDCGIISKRHGYLQQRQEAFVLCFEIFSDDHIINSSRIG